MPTCDRCGGEIEFRRVDGATTPIHLSGGGCSGGGGGTGGGGGWWRRDGHDIDDSCWPSRCPRCGADVFFVRHNGGSVWLDDLGWPWPVHSCFEKWGGLGKALDSLQRVAGQAGENAQFILIGSVAAKKKHGAFDEIAVRAADATQPFYIRADKTNLVGAVVLVRVDKTFSRVLQVADLHGKAIPRAEKQPPLPRAAAGQFRVARRKSEKGAGAGHAGRSLRSQYWWESPPFPVPVNTGTFEQIVREVLTAAKRRDEKLVEEFEKRLERLNICGDVIVFVPATPPPMDVVRVEWPALEASIEAIFRRTRQQLVQEHGLLLLCSSAILARLQQLKQGGSPSTKRVVETLVEIVRRQYHAVNA